MKILLRIDCSSRKDGSHSRKLADVFEKNWKLANENGKIIYRDLAVFEVPHISNDTIEAFYTPENNLTLKQKEALLISDEFISELYAADEILISSPLYNLNVPSSLKAYFDQVVRPNKTFSTKDNGTIVGMLAQKVAHLVLVKGGFYENTVLEPFDFQKPYLEAILQFIGISVRNVFSLEGTSTSEGNDKRFDSIQTKIQETFKYIIQ